MAKNVEIKARLGDPDSVARLAASIADSGPTLILQDDTFFNCSEGRLKLRVFGSGEGELIFYQRADTLEPSESFYIRSEVPSPDSMRQALSLACGTVGRVVKRRTLFLVGRTRVHLDAVEGLGNFLELEVVLRDDETAEDGVAEAEVLMSRLGVDPSALVARAYVDLINASTFTGPKSTAN